MISRADWAGMVLLGAIPRYRDHSKTEITKVPEVYSAQNNYSAPRGECFNLKDNPGAQERQDRDTSKLGIDMYV